MRLATTQVAADVASESIVDGANRGHLFSIRRRRGRDRRAVEDAHVLREPGDHQIDVHLRELLRRDGGAGFHQHFEPHAETIGVELLVQARLAGAPQVEIEDARQLVGCRQRHELAAILESAALNDPVKQLGLQSRDDVREVRRVQNAIEQRTLVSSVSPCRTVARPTRAVGGRVCQSARRSHGDDEYDEWILA